MKYHPIPLSFYISIQSTLLRKNYIAKYWIIMLSRVPGGNKRGEKCIGNTLKLHCAELRCAELFVMRNPALREPDVCKSAAT